MFKYFTIIFSFFFVSNCWAQIFTGSGGAIPDMGPRTCFPVNVSGVGVIDGTYGLANVCININHPFDTDLEIILKAPDGTIVQLSIQNGGTGANYTNTCFSANATIPIGGGTAPFSGSFLPQGYLGNVNNGQLADGIWELCIQDVSSQDVGNLTGWSLNFTNMPAPPAPACSSNPPAGNTCATATPVCNLNGFCGNTSTAYTADTWPELTSAFCGIIENNSFISFVASSSSASFNVWVNNSLNGLGIQMMIFGGGCGSGPVTSYGCKSQILPSSTGPTLIAATGLVPGNTYYIMIDGFNGDVCDYTIVAATGINILSITPSTTSICKGQRINLTASGGDGTYTWQPGGLTGSVINLLPDSTKTYSVFSTPSGNCPLQSDITITVRAKPDLGADKIVRICASGSVNLNNQYNTTGFTKNWTIGGVPVANQSAVSTAGIYRLIISNLAGCYDTAFVTIIVGSTPSLGPDRGVIACQGRTFDLTQLFPTTGLTSNWTLGSIPVTIPTAVSAAGSYQLIASAGANCADTAFFNLAISARPNLGADKLANVCAGSSFDLTTQFVTTGLTANWTIGGIPVPSITAVTDSGKYRLIAINTADVFRLGCADTALLTLAIKQKPNIGNDRNVNICPGVFVDLYSLFDTTGLVTNWSFGGLPVASPSNVTAAGTYKLVATNIYGCTDSALVNLTVSAKLNLGADKAENLCPGRSLDLEMEYITSSLTANWTFGGFPVPLINSVTAPGVYQLIATNGSNCVDTALVTISLKPRPNLGADKAASICENNSINLKAQFVLTGLGDFWSNAAGVVSNPVTATIPGIYRLIATDGSNCTDTAFFNLTTMPAPNLGADKTDSICPGEVFDLTGIYTPFFLNSWTIGNAPVTNPTTVKIAGQYQFIGTLANGCSDTSLITLHINAKPVLGSDKAVAFCPGSSLGLTAQYNTTGLTTNWYFGSMPVTAPNSIVLSGAYQLIATNIEGCSDTASVAVTIYPKPLLGIDKKLTSCFGKGIDLTVQYNTTGLTPVWTSGGLPVSNLSNITFSGIYQLVAANGNSCTDTVFLTLLVYPLPPLGTDKTESICSGQSINLIDLFDTTGLFLTWTKANVPVSNPESITNAGVYQLIATNIPGCIDTALVYVRINPKPIAGRDTIVHICPGSLVNLPSFYNTSGLTTDWTKIGVTVADPTTVNTGGIYQLVVKNSFGCLDTALVTVVINATSSSITMLGICPADLPYSWNGINCAIAGNYVATLINAGGCDSIATLQLTVKTNSNSITRLSICPADLPFRWNSINYSGSGTYASTLVNAAGCDSIAALELTVKSNSSSITRQSICPADLPFRWNSINYSAGGTYNVTLVNAAGCDSIATLVLTVKSNSSSTTRVNICPADLPFRWNSIDYSATGTYTSTLVNAADCDSVATLYLMIKSNSSSVTTVNVCPVQLPYLWNGNNYSLSGNYTSTLVNAAGCDSVAVLELIVKTTSASTTILSICPGALPYNWNGINCITGGTYTTTLVNAAGCDSVAILDLSIKANSSSSTSISICPLDLPLHWNNINYAAAGTYTVTLVNAAGCDSIATLQLFVKSNTSSNTTVNICPSDLPFRWNNVDYTIAGVYNIHLVNAAGCDSSTTLDLTVKTASSSFTTRNICPGQLPFSWNGNSYTRSGTYLVSFFNAAGCDSIATLELIVNPTTYSVTAISICPGDLPFLWNNINYPSAGTYPITLINAGGCDSSATLELTVKANSGSITRQSICPANLPFRWNNINYSSAGAYPVTLINAAGCDSIATLELTVKANTNSITSLSICPSDLPFRWNSIDYAGAGTYTSTLVNAAGCDSIATLQLIVNSISSSITTLRICPADLPFRWNNINYARSGTYTSTLVNAVGCDSIATLELIVKSNSSSLTTVHVCPGQLPYTWNSNNYSLSGNYTSRLVNVVGCDSIATLELIVETSTTSITKKNICVADLPFSWNGNVYSLSGTYASTLVNAVGCDSIATLELAVHLASSSITSISICPSALPYNWNGLNCPAGGRYAVTLVNAAGCDSIATLKLIVKHASSSISRVNVCPSDLPYNWNNSNYTTTGLYTAIFVNAAGCDSVATLELIVKSNSSSLETIIICPGQLPFRWNNTGYTLSGTYTASFLNSAGCDSIATLQLTVNAASSSVTSKSICSASLPYLWNNNNYTSTGSYTVTLSNAAGCDSIATLQLIVNQVGNSLATVSVCPGQLPYNWNGNNYSSAGNYSKTFVNATGCDSVATLVLIVKAITSSTTPVSICPADLPFLWNNVSYSSAGRYAVTLVNAAGCDSVATLELKVKSSSSSTSNQALCANQLPYNWYGLSVNTAGSYTTTLVNAAGCDSVITLRFTVNPNPDQFFLGNDTLLCPNEHLILNAGNYASYLWQDNSINPVFNVSGAGLYTVEVATDKGCKSKDEIEVKILANCDDIYFPNAFTPNGDGLNDSFGPLGNLFVVSNYTLKIFNRYGEMVFNTNNPYQRWNGNHHSSAISNTSFVWVSTYLFLGKVNKIQKGNLTLLH